MTALTSFPQPVTSTLKPWVELTRVKKFAGTMVLFWPFAWSLTMMARNMSLTGAAHSVLLAQGFVGACLLHSLSQAAAAYGMTYWTENLIVKLRTKHRPLADGRITVPGALIFLLVHLSLLVRMIWSTDPITWRLGLVGIFLLPGIYPLMKRVTYWPQAWLGLAMNIGVPMSSVVLTKGITKCAMVLAVGAWAWTIWYDTIYACQDKKDDAQAGVKSTALLFADWTKPVLSVFGSILVSTLIICGILNKAGLPYFVISIGGGSILLAKELWQVDLDVPKSCWETFHRNGFTFGAVVWSGIFLDYLVSTWNVTM